SKIREPGAKFARAASSTVASRPPVWNSSTGDRSAGSSRSGSFPRGDERVENLLLQAVVGVMAGDAFFDGGGRSGRIGRGPVHGVSSHPLVRPKPVCNCPLATSRATLYT